MPAGFVVAVVLASLAASAGPTPAPSPTPTPRPAATVRPRVSEQVEKALDEKERTEPPRFESSIEVLGQSPQAILERVLRGIDLECGPTGGGPPTEAETRAFRPHLSPSADLLALAKLLAKKAKGKGPDRFFLYLARRGDGVSYTVREGRMPDAEFYNTTGTSFELVEAFADVKEATAALRRLEQGFATAAPRDAGSPSPPWSTAPCLPRKK